MRIEVSLIVDVEKVGREKKGKYRYTKDLSGLSPHYFLLDRPKLLVRNENGEVLSAKVKILSQQILELEQ